MCELLGRGLHSLSAFFWWSRCLPSHEPHCSSLVASPLSPRQQMKSASHTQQMGCRNSSLLYQMDGSLLFFSHQCASCGEARFQMRSSVVPGLISDISTVAAKRMVFTGKKKKKKSSRLWWMFNIRCCLFEILSLWLDQKIQMIRTRPPKHPQSDE